MPNSQSIDTKKHFFFAEAQAGMYDLTIGLIVPHYELMHQTVLDVLGSCRSAAKGTILDVGSGTGTDSISILRQFPRSSVVALDLCAPIQEVHREKLRQSGSENAGLEQRTSLIEGDILSFADNLDPLLHHAPGGYSAIVSSLVVHHFSHAEKLSFYRLAYKLLRPGGILINADLYSYTDEKQDRFANAFDARWMKSHLLDTCKADSSTDKASLSHRKMIFKRWQWHYKNSNNLEPIEDAGRTPGQMTMLKRAGFRNVAAPYRMALSGILVGHKIAE